MADLFRRRMRERSLHGYILIPTFDDGGDHFEPHVGFDGVAGMGGDDDGFSRIEQVGLIVDDDLGLAVNYLDKGVEWGDFFCQRFTRVKRRDCYIPGCLFDDGFDYHRVGDVFYDFHDDKGRSLFLF